MGDYVEFNPENAKLSLDDAPSYPFQITNEYKEVMRLQPDGMLVFAGNEEQKVHVDDFIASLEGFCSFIRGLKTQVCDT